MPWFVAHAIVSLEHIEEPRDDFLVWENLILIEAADSQLAWSLAQQRGAEDATSAEDCFLPDGRPRHQLDDRPARWRFVGVRKVVSVAHFAEEGVLRSGDELSYNEFEATSQAQVESLARGKEVTILRSAVGYPEGEP